MEGIFCKNLLLKDRKGRFFYILCQEESKVDMKKLKNDLCASRNLSFATDVELLNLFQTKPGAVTPFSFLFPSAKVVHCVMDSFFQRFRGTDIILNFHPFSPDRTTLITFPNLLRFLEDCGVDIKFIDMYS